MISLQWGTTIGYDILVFDKVGKVAFIEVKSTASYPRRWVLQSKYANPKFDAIPLERRFVCCVDISSKEHEPSVHVFTAEIVSRGLHYYFNSRFPNSASYHLSLDFKPQGQSKAARTKTVGQFTDENKYLENYRLLGISPVDR